MKAIAVLPGQPGSVHLAELEKPSLSDVPNGTGVLVNAMPEYDDVARAAADLGRPVADVLADAVAASRKLLG